MKKKLLAMLLAICLVVGGALPAVFADDTTPPADPPKVEDSTEEKGDDKKEETPPVVEEKPDAPKDEPKKDETPKEEPKEEAPPVVEEEKKDETLKAEEAPVAEDTPQQAFEKLLVKDAKITLKSGDDLAIPDGITVTGIAITVPTGATLRDYWKIGASNKVVADSGASLRWGTGTSDNLFVGTGGHIVLSSGSTFTVIGKASSKADYELAGGASFNQLGSTPNPTLIDTDQTFTVKSGTLTISASTKTTVPSAYVPTLSVHKTGGKLVIESSATLTLVKDALVVLGNGKTSIDLKGTLVDNSGTYNATNKIVGFVNDTGEVVKLVTEPEVFAETTVLETVAGSQVSGGNWYDPPFKGAVTKSNVVVTSELPLNAIVDKTASSTLFAALDSINGKGYPSGDADKNPVPVGATRNLGMSIPVPTGKDITKVSAKVKVGTETERAATIYAAKGDSNTAGVGPALEPTDGKAALGDNTHLVFYPLIAQKTSTTAWQISGPTEYTWTYTYYNASNAVVGTQAVNVKINYAAVTGNNANLKAAIDQATALKDSVVVGTDAATIGKDVKWAVQADITAYGTAITTATTANNKSGSTQAQFDAALATLNTATATFNGKVKVGTKTAEEKNVPAITTDDASVSIPDATNANDAVIAKVPDTAITAGNAATIKAPTTGIVVSIEVPKETLSKATADAPITLNTADSSGNVIAEWEFTAPPTEKVDLLVSPKETAKDIPVTGVVGFTPAVSEKATFTHHGVLPANTTVTIPTTLTASNAFAYFLDSAGKINLNDSEITVTIANGKATFKLPHCSSILISPTRITKPGVTPPPVNPPVVTPPVTPPAPTMPWLPEPSYPTNYYSGGSSYTAPNTIAAFIGDTKIAQASGGLITEASDSTLENRKFIITPDSGYKIYDVRAGGISFGATPALSLSRPATDQTVSAVFVVDTPTQDAVTDTTTNNNNTTTSNPQTGDSTPFVAVVILLFAGIGTLIIGKKVRKFN